MRRLFLAALLLSAACGGSGTTLSDGCSKTTPLETFSFHAQQQLPTCGFPATFDLSLTVTSDGATGIEAGVPFTAARYSSCQLTWSDATTLHVIEVDSRTDGTETLVRSADGCSGVYTLSP